MPRINLLTQGSLLQHEGNYTIGYALSNNDFVLVENAVICAENIINSHPPTAPNFSAVDMLKGFLVSLDAFKTWKIMYLQDLDTKQNPIPSNIFLRLPVYECAMTLGTMVDDNKPSQMIELELLDVQDIAKSLRIAYELGVNVDSFESVSQVWALLEVFEGFLSTYDNSANQGYIAQAL